MNLGPYPSLAFSRVIVADTETTGLSPFDPTSPDRLCSAAFWSLLNTGDRWIMEDCKTIMVDPQRPLPEEAARVNGFHWSGDGSLMPDMRQDLYGLPSFQEQWPAVASFLEDTPLVFHNAAFDVAFLDAELQRAGFKPLHQPILCTKKAFSDLLGKGRPFAYVPKTNLNALSALCGVDSSARQGPNGQELHGAKVDAKMAAECFMVLDKAGWMVAENPADFPHRG